MSSTPPINPKAQRKAEKAYAKASRPWYKKKRFWVLGLLALLILAMALGGGGDDKPQNAGGDNGATTQQRSESKAPQEKPLAVTPDKLIEDLEFNALKASEAYKGKRVTLTGPISNIDASGQYFNISGSDEFSLTSIRIDIDEEQRGIISKKSKGDKVTVTGEVAQVGEVLGFGIDAESIK